MMDIEIIDHALVPPPAEEANSAGELDGALLPPPEPAAPMSDADSSFILYFAQRVATTLLLRPDVGRRNLNGTPIPWLCIRFPLGCTHSFCYGFRLISRFIIEFYWKSTGNLLDIYWNSTGNLLDIYWNSTGILLEFYWKSNGHPECLGKSPRYFSP